MTPQTPQAPPSAAAVAWIQTAQSAARQARRALVRLTIDHYRELTPTQQADLTQVRREATTVVLLVAELTRQLERAASAPPADPWTDADEAEARADIDYDNHVNAF